MKARDWGRVAAAAKGTVQAIPRVSRVSIKALRFRSHLVNVGFPFTPRGRWGHGLPDHRRLCEIIGRNRAEYRSLLERFSDVADDLAQIGHAPVGVNSGEPVWRNNMFSGLDAIALYHLLASGNPRSYVEIGSGNSTRFARRAIRDHGLRTRITCVDPSPRVDITAVADEHIAQPLEELDTAVFGDLEAGDILFLDGSHLVFPNCDTTVFFMDVLPYLPAGVLVHIHDIWLPADYPPEWMDRNYAEQYLLAAWLLAEGSRLEIVLPVAFVAADAELAAVVAPLAERIGLDAAKGGSFWLRTRAGLDAGPS